MTTEIYLVFTSNGFTSAKKTCCFNLSPGERAIKLAVSIPDEAFEPASLLHIAANIPIEMVLRPAVDVVHAVEDPEGA